MISVFLLLVYRAMAGMIETLDFSMDYINIGFTS